MSFASIQVVYTSIMKIVDYVTFDTSCNRTFYGDGSSVDEWGNETTVCGTLEDLTKALSPCMAGADGPTVEIDTIMICVTTIGRLEFAPF